MIRLKKVGTDLLEEFGQSHTRWLKTAGVKPYISFIEIMMTSHVGFCMLKVG